MYSMDDVSDADYYLRTGGSGCGGGGGGHGSEVDDMLAYLSKGEPPGEWLFPYRNDVGVSGKIIPEQPSGEQFRTALNELKHPVTKKKLGRAPQHFQSTAEKLAEWKLKNPDAIPEQVKAAKTRFEKAKAHAVHAWDGTFSVVKSISVAHAALEWEARTAEADAAEAEAAGLLDEAEDLREQAAAAQADADEVIAAMREGIDAAMKMAADEFGVTRRGAAGPDIDGKTTMRHVQEKNLQCAIFVHKTSRARDPQLHAHVMTLNRILCGDGQWRALFASGWLKSKHQLDVVFTRTMNARLTRTLGWRFAMRPDGKAREVVGVSEQVRDLFSERTRELDEKAAEKLLAWQEKYDIDAEDVPPIVRWRFQQRATIESRKGKPKAQDTPTREQDIRRWDAAIARDFREGFAGVLDDVQAASRRPLPDSDFDPEVVIAQAVAHLTENKATFNRSQMMFAIDRFFPDMPDMDGPEIIAWISDLAEKALAGEEVISTAAPAPIPVPASLINPVTGESVFEPPRGGRYTTRTHLKREDWLVDLLKRRGAPTLARADAKAAVSGRDLSVEQSTVAADILTSDWFLQIVEAGAGTGKSRLMAALSDVSSDIWGQGLTGFTASQNAAEVLTREGVHRAHNIAKFLKYRERVHEGTATDVDHAKYAVPPNSTVVVDEASMVGTPPAVKLVRELLEMGVGRVVFIGDTAQVDAVEAGGGFALLVNEVEKSRKAREHAAVRGLPAPGDPEDPARQVHTLTQVRRFKTRGEAEASSRLRAGDIEALAWYETRGRIQGDGLEPEEVERRAVQAYVDDYMLGAESVLIVGTGKKAAELSSKIRARLVAAGRVREDGAALHDRTTAGVGDLIQTRMNSRDPDVVNREIWRVDAVDALTGALTVRRAERDERDRRVWGTPRELPGQYVREHVELAYSATVQAVQGRTTDTSHLLIDEMMGRSRAYPGLTRGRRRNTMWVPVERPTRRHMESDEDYERRIPSAMSKVVAAFEREDHTDAARTVIAAEQARAENMGHLGPQWQQLIYEHRAGAHRKMIREIVGTDAEALFADEAVEGVLHLLRGAESHGYDIREAVKRAYGQHRLAHARNPGALLYDLLNRYLERPDVKPREQAATRAETYADKVPGGEGEIAFAKETGRLMDARVSVLGELAEVEPPAWATALLGGVPADIVARGEWREKVGIVAGYREQYGWRSEIDPVGPAPSRSDPERRWAWLRATRALGVTQQRDVVTASDAELVSRVQKWWREQEQMPRNVDEDLERTNKALVEAKRMVVEAKTRGENPAAAVRLWQSMERRAARLDGIDEGRQDLVEHTAPVRDRAQEAMAEMRRRAEQDRAVAERKRARYEVQAREQARVEQEAKDRDTRVHLAVGERWREQWVPDAPVLGSERWAELDDAAQEKRAGLFTAALQSWRQGNRLNERELTERLEAHGLERVPDDPDEHMPRRVLDRIRGGMEEREARALEPTGRLEVLTKVLRYAEEDLRGEAPQFGTPEYADAPPEQKKRAETREALRWWNAGDDLDERKARAEAAEGKEATWEIAEATRADRANYRGHREVAQARGEEPPAERAPINEEPPVVPLPPRPDTSWVRKAEQLERKVEPAERKSERERETAGNEPAAPREPKVRESAPQRESAANEPTREREPAQVTPSRDDDARTQPAPEPKPVERKPERERVSVKDDEPEARVREAADDGHAPKPVEKKPEREREAAPAREEPEPKAVEEKPAPERKQPEPKALERKPEREPVERKQPERKPEPERARDESRDKAREVARDRARDESRDKVREAAAASRDDLAEQAAKAKAASERVRAEREAAQTRDREQAQARERETTPPPREKEPVRDRGSEDMQR